MGLRKTLDFRRTYAFLFFRGNVPVEVRNVYGDLVLARFAWGGLRYLFDA